MNQNVGETHLENVTVRGDSNLFADDTTALGKKSKLNEGMKITRYVMNSFEERNNDEGRNTMLLGSYNVTKEDINQIIKRAINAWRRVKSQLKGTRLMKRTQARIVKAVIESTMPFDCQIRTWYIKDIKRLQQYIDKAYRYIWSRKSKPPTMEIQKRGINM